MGPVKLGDTQSRADFFSRSVLANLTYWQDWLAANQSNLVALEQDYSNLLRGLVFALDLAGPAWLPLYKLIEEFSPYMERRGHWQVWQELLERALTTAKQVEDQAAEVTLTALLARLSFQQSRFDATVRLYRRAIRLARSVDDRFNLGRACTNLGYYYIEHRQLWRAEVLCMFALRLFEQLGSHHGRAHTENHLGTMYIWQNRWEQARQHLEQACALWQAMGDDHGLMRGLTNLSTLYLRMEQAEPALNCLTQALQQATLAGEEAIIGRIYMNMGLAYTISRDFPAAEMYTRQAEIIFQQYSDINGLARIWGNLGVIYAHQGKWSEALLHFEKSLQTWRNLGLKEDEIMTLIDLVESEQIRDNHEQAHTYLQEVEHLLGPNRESYLYRYLQPRLTQCRRKLEDAGQSLHKPNNI